MASVSSVVWTTNHAKLVQHLAEQLGIPPIPAESIADELFDFAYDPSLDQLREIVHRRGLRADGIAQMNHARTSAREGRVKVEYFPDERPKRRARRRQLEG